MHTLCSGALDGLTGSSDNKANKQQTGRVEPILGILALCAHQLCALYLNIPAALRNFANILNEENTDAFQAVDQIGILHSGAPFFFLLS